jgi:NAD(P)-dependent dehydrogenase (short-subunit alcohol dehydrogenase family)
MKIHDKSVVITGGGRGIGAALATRFAKETPRGVIVSDIDLPAAQGVAAQLRATGVPALALRTDVTNPADIAELVALAEREFGGTDLLCSNAGISSGMGVHAVDAQWTRTWNVNVMAHVHLVQALLPGWVRRREGYMVITSSAAGLLGLPGDAAYTVTKHAAVGLAEWLACTYSHLGIKFSALCPLGVRTEFLMPGVEIGHPAARAVADSGPIIEPADVAEATVRGIADERFLILPHAEVGEMQQRKVADVDAWIASTPLAAKSSASPNGTTQR